MERLSGQHKAMDDRTLKPQRELILETCLSSRSVGGSGGDGVKEESALKRLQRFSMA